MGREIKRVALDFDWPMDVVWRGYLNPHPYEQCPWCKGRGLSPEAQQVSDDWYDFAGTGRRWCDAITDDEVAALIEAGRLRDFTHTWSRETGWQRRADGYVPSAEEVNAWQRGPGMGHDSINAWVCLEARCKRLGITHDCAKCDGTGELWSSLEAKRRHDEWERSGPPPGEGWQLWETVSEGSPITPVFTTAEDLARYLSTTGDDWHHKRVERVKSLRARGYDEPIPQLPTYEQALAFVCAGWAPSTMVSGGVATDALGEKVTP